MVRIVFMVFAEGKLDAVIIRGSNASFDCPKRRDPIAIRGLDHVWVVSDEADTSVSSTDCACGRAILTTSTVEDFTGCWGEGKNVPPDVSDPYLVWAEFHTGRDSD